METNGRKEVVDAVITTACTVLVTAIVTAAIEQVKKIKVSIGSKDDKIEQ